MNRAEASSIVQDYVKNDGLIRHMLSVEAAMRAYAQKYGENPDSWGIVGLLHDFDWEIHPLSTSTRKMVRRFRVSVVCRKSIFAVIPNIQLFP